MVDWWCNKQQQVGRSLSTQVGKRWPPTAWKFFKTDSLDLSVYTSNRPVRDSISGRDLLTWWTAWPYIHIQDKGMKCGFQNKFHLLSKIKNIFMRPTFTTFKNWRVLTFCGWLVGHCRGKREAWSVKGATSWTREQKGSGWIISDEGLSVDVTGNHKIWK